MHGLLRDVRYACRSLSRSASLTVIATLALTFGIGLTTTMFSIVYGALLTEPPYPDGARVVAVQRMRPARSPEPLPLTIHDYVAYRSQQRSFTDLAAYTTGTMYLSGDEKAERFDGTWVTVNTFDVLEVPPILGRAFRKGDGAPNAERVVMLSYATWRERYGKDSSTIGTVVRVNGAPHTIVGVMPEHFKFARTSQLWVPLVVDPLPTARQEGQPLSGIGRLKPGVSVASASADLANISRQLEIDYKESNAGFVGFAATFIDAYAPPGPKRLLRVMLGAVFAVLLIACANVASLLLDRAVHRAREVGVRIALGASRTAIIRHSLAEALVLSGMATLAGIGIAFVGVRMFDRAVAATNVPFWMDFRLHPAVFGFTAVMALLTTLSAGALPAWQSSRADINEVLKDESRGASSFRIGRISNALVMFEIALSCTLLVAAGLMIKSIFRANTFEPGYTNQNVFTARIGFPAFFTDTLAEWRFFDEMLARVSALPGVQAAAMSTGLPATRAGFGGTRFALAGKSYLKPDDRPEARLAGVTPQFFAAINAPLLAGRAFTSADRAGSLPVVVVSRAFARKYLSNGDPGDSGNPVGQRIQLGEGQPPSPWLTVVGVVGDMFDGDQRDPSPPILFQPLAQARSNFVSIVVRTNTQPMAITPAVREAVQSINADVPLYWVQSFDEATAGSLWFVKVFGTLFLVFGIVALFLASVGLYAVMAFSVSRRTRELGIRMALGATAQNVVRVTLGRGMSRLAVGVSLGLVFAFAGSRLLQFILFQVQPLDPVVFGGVVVVLVVVGMVACLIPARRATQVDPMIALRRE